MKSLVDMTDLESAAVISLTAERRFEDRGGYWVEALDGNTFGSHLWRLGRSILNHETLSLAEHYAAESLEWMLTKGLVNDIKVDGRIEGDRLILNVNLGEVSVAHRI